MVIYHAALAHSGDDSGQEEEYNYINHLLFFVLIFVLLIHVSMIKNTEKTIVLNKREICFLMSSIIAD